MEAILSKFREPFDESLGYDPKPVNMDTLQEYLKENGTEKAQAFLEGIELMTKNVNIRFIGMADAKDGLHAGVSPYVSRTQLMDLRDEVKTLLEAAKNAGYPCTSLQSNELNK